MDKHYKYDAFISYRHLEHDKTIAAKLQKMLEAYKPPKSVCKNFKQWHIFRDETELPTSSNLSGDIKNALENSRFLIVICSKSTKESRWCLEEITYFKELHKGNNSNIITLIVDGEPSEVFPEELCNEMIEVKDSDGNVSYQSHVIEPLAANVSANSTKESLKKLKSEFLRIAAPLLDCGYDTLYNRNQRRHIRRIVIVASLIMSALVAFGLYTSAMLFEINAQKSALQDKTDELDKSNKELKETNISLEQKTKEAQENFEEANRQKNVAEINLLEAERQRKIAEENLEEAERQKKIAEENMLIAQENEARANEQTRLAQIENSENLSILSENLWNSGDGVAAIQTVLSALPQEGENRPVVADAQRILANEIGAYSRETFSPILKVSHNKAIELIGYAGNGSTLVTRDETGVYLWNAVTGELISKLAKEEFGTSTLDVRVEDNGEIESSSLTKITGSAFIMDQYSIHGYEKVQTDEVNTSGEDLYVYSESSPIYKVDGKTGEIIWEIFDKKNYYSVNSYLTHNKAVRQYSASVGNYVIDIHNLDNGSLEKTYTLSDYKLPYSLNGGWMSFGDKKCYYNNGGILNNQIIAFDIVDDKICNPEIIFEYSSDGAYSRSELITSEVIDGDLITLYAYTDTILDSYTAICVYDYNSSKEKWKYDLGSSDSVYAFVGKLYSENTKSYCDMIFAATGDKLVLFESDTGKLIHEYLLSGDVVDLYYSKDGIIYLLTNNGIELAAHIKGTTKEQFNNEHYVGIYQTRKFLSKAEKIVYYDGSYAVANENSNEAYIYADVKNEDFVEIYENEIKSSNSDVLVNDMGTFAVVNALKKLIVYNIEDESSYKLDEFNHVQSYSFIQEEYLAVYEYDGESKYYLNIYDLTTCKKILKTECENVRMSSGIKTVGSKVVLLRSNDVSFVDIDGEESKWIPQAQGKNSGYIMNFDVSENGKAVALINYYGQTGIRLEIYDVNTQETVILDAPIRELSIDSQKINGFTWLNSGLLVLSLKDNTVLFSDCQYLAHE